MSEQEWVAEARDPEDWRARQAAAFVNSILDDPEIQWQMTEAAVEALRRYFLYDELPEPPDAP